MKARLLRKLRKEAKKKYRGGYSGLSDHPYGVHELNDMKTHLAYAYMTKVELKEGLAEFRRMYIMGEVCKLRRKRKIEEINKEISKY